MAGTQQVDERVARLEEGLITLTRDVGALSRNVELIGQRVAAQGRPDWGVLISGAFLILALFSAGLVPVYQRAGYALDAANAAKGWQESYMRHEIPSSADTEIAALRQQFVEVETQFHGFKDRMVENEGYTRERADTNHGDITELRRTVTEQGQGLVRLDERSHREH